MRKILFVINSLNVGGSEKSLVSLLNMIDYKKNSVDLQMLKSGGEFDKYIPKEVNILEVPKYYRYLQSGGYISNFENMYVRMKTTYNLKRNSKSKKPINNEQIIYLNQKRVLEKNERDYDIAIAYSQGFPTYYVAEKVKASKKISWINCDYTNTTYDKNIDEIFYGKFNKIVAVSKTIEKSIRSMKKNYTDKLEVILDIVNPDFIKKMSESKESHLFNKEFLNIVTVGRIAYAKGHERIIFVAKILKENDYKFRWHIVGDGPDKQKIEKLIRENDVEECIVLWGEQSNPYPFMKECDIYIQPSSKEGFGLTVVEAKILKKPIICTAFNTAFELINNEVDGLIVGFEHLEIYRGIQRFLEEKNLKERILKNLNSQEEYNSTKEFKKFLKMVEG